MFEFSFFFNISNKCCINVMQPTSKVSSFSWNQQRAKKVVSDSPGLVNFAIELVNLVF